ncbi:unnamed protein product [Diamesa serratosioi]
MNHILNINPKGKFNNIVRFTGITCTIGVNNEPDVLVGWMKAGMNIARLNFSHTDQEHHAISIKNIRQAVADYKKEIGYEFPLAIALDTKGPEIRTGKFEPVEGDDTAEGKSNEVELIKDEKIKITTNKDLFESQTKEQIYVDYPNIVKVLNVGDRIFIDDGLIELKVETIEADILECTIVNGGTLGNQKGVNLPDTTVDLPALSDKDKSDIMFGVEQGVDIIFASFIQNAAGVDSIRSCLCGEKGRNIKIMAKIESQEGLDNLDEIIEKADGILVARGDLGIEIPPEKVFLAQKQMIAKCNKVGKPCIVATQMLDSMTNNPRPTRAEVTDVANAVLEGADVTMLSGETAKGCFPLESIAMMAKIHFEAEAIIDYDKLFSELATYAPMPACATHSTALASVVTSSKTMATAIIVLTISGHTAHLISKYRPKCPIIAITPCVQTARQCHLYRGVMPFVYQEDDVSICWEKLNEDRINYAIRMGKKFKFLKTGNNIVVVSGSKAGTGFTNTMRVM